MRVPSLLDLDFFSHDTLFFFSRLAIQVFSQGEIIPNPVHISGSVILNRFSDDFLLELLLVHLFAFGGLFLHLLVIFVEIFSHKLFSCFLQGIQRMSCHFTHEPSQNLVFVNVRHLGLDFKACELVVKDVHLVSEILSHICFVESSEVNAIFDIYHFI